MPSLSSTHVITFETVVLDQTGVVSKRLEGQAQVAVADLGNGVNLELVAVAGGSFQMGSRHEGGYEDEQPVHPVFLLPFWLGRTPITQAQWQAVMGKLPNCRFHGPNRPIENINWQEANEFCKRCSKKIGRLFTLPSESQWEYACRAGTITPFSFGETLTTDYVNYVGDHTFRSEPPGIYRHGTTPVGSFPPNHWGLADMHGQLWEFCADTWQADYTGASVNGSPRENRQGVGARDHVARGGSWHEPPTHCRSAVRLKVQDNERLEFYGLRVMST